MPQRQRRGSIARPLLLAVGFVLVLGVSSRAEVPRVEGTRPFGVARGVKTVLTIEGSHLGPNPVLLASFPFTTAALADGMAADGKKWGLELTVDRGTAPGVHVARVRTDDGVSNPFLLAVGVVDQVVEQEDNGGEAKAQVVVAPVVVEGEIAGSDVDFFRFSGKKGQRIVVDAWCARIGSGVDPVVRLSTASGKFVAEDDDAPGLLTDARIAVELPEDGDYVAEIADTRYQGQPRAIYRLALGEVPTAAEVFPLGGRRGETLGLELKGGTIMGSRGVSVSLAAPAGVARFSPLEITGQDLALPTMLGVSDYLEVREPAEDSAAPIRVGIPVVLNGRLDPTADEDRFALVGLTPGQKLRLVVEALGYASNVDGVIRVLGSGGGEVARGDDSNVVVTNKGQKNAAPITSPDPALEVVVPADSNSLTLSFSDLNGRGGLAYPYRITVEEARPSFELEPIPSELNVPKGGWSNLPVNVSRAGFNGPIRLKLENPPAGLLVREGMVAEGQIGGVLSVGLAAGASFEPGELRLVGEGQGVDPPLVVRASKPVIFASIQGFPTNVVPLPSLAASPTSASPVVLVTPESPLEIAHGSGASVPVTVARTEGSSGALELEAVSPPAGLDAPKLTIAEAATEGAIVLNASADAPVGTASVAFTAKGKIGGVDRVVSVPAVTVQIVRPATLVLEAATVDIKPGATVELKGKLERKPSFKQEVVVRLEGLPGGVKAEPITLAGDASEFTIKIDAEAGAAAAEAQAKVIAAFKIGDKDYPAPPQLVLPLKVVP